MKKTLSTVNREYIVSMKHENYKTISLIITAAKTNMCEASISAECVWMMSKRILCTCRNDVWVFFTLRLATLTLQ